MRKVAVTGGLACGKTTVCRFLKEFGAFVISADTIVHQLLSEDKATANAVIDLLGPGIVRSNTIDRIEVAKRVFGDPSLLEALEKLLHPRVHQEVFRLYEEVRTKDIPLFVVEIPLLFEVKMDSDYDATIAVVSSEALCRARFANVGKAGDDFDIRSKRQLPLDEKAKRATYVLVNNGTLKELYQATCVLFKSLTNPQKEPQVDEPRNR